MDTEDKTREILDNKFMTNFGMTIDQFERLDFETQDALIKKVIKLSRRKKKLIKIKEILEQYPIFKKTLVKRKSLLKK